MAASRWKGRGGSGSGKQDDMGLPDDSSESEGETEPAKAFHRRISTNRELKTTKCIKEGYLMKQTNSFQRWRRRYFKLKGRKFYYAKDTKSVIFDEIELTDLSLAECGTKNVNHSFQVITPFRNLVLCADSRKEMEEWIVALKAAANREFYDPNADHREMLSGQHNWYACSHARPTYCNVCKEALSGVTSHGLSCEVCKFKAHKRCAVRASTNCKWTTLASVGRDIIEEEDGNLSMPHQWLEGNLPVSAKCAVCDRTCGSVLRLQDWRCLWCKAMVHNSCLTTLTKRCPLGQHRVSVLPPIAINNLDSDGFWEAQRPPGTSPLLVFINSKSGDNQGVKMLRRFKQLLNPAQVFDLMNGGPHMGLRLFQKFDLFRILVCGGDGSIGWVLTDIDKLNLHKQCQVGVLPLGTGNDLSRVLGWGPAFDDDAQLPMVVEKLEHAQIRMLDRWSTYIFEGSMPPPRKITQEVDISEDFKFDPISMYEDSVATHLTKILHSDNHSVVISSAKVLCETVKDFVAKVGEAHKEDQGEDSIAKKCAILNEKLDALLNTLNEESQAVTMVTSPIAQPATIPEPPELGEDGEDPGTPVDLDTMPEGLHIPTSSKSTIFKPRDALMSRANSLKKAVRKIIEHTEKAVDEQNAQTLEQQQTYAATRPSHIGIAMVTGDTPVGSPDHHDNRLEEEEGTLSDGEGVGSMQQIMSPERDKSLRGPPSRRISSMSTFVKSNSLNSSLNTKEVRSPTSEMSPTLTPAPATLVPAFPMLPRALKQALAYRAAIPKHFPGLSSGVAGSLAGGSFISKVLLANADALCAAASPLMEEDIDLSKYEERCVMNNYFGIGLDAKISLDFHLKREEHPEKCRSRTKNMVWYGVLGGKEIVNRTFKNLDQRVQLECDGQRIPLPNLQGLVVLNILSYMGGTNFWGGTKEDDNFKAPSMDDKILEVVAVFGSAHMGISRVINLQHHRIAQCRSVKISIMGDEGVPVQVDGEAFLQPPGYIRIVHKNRAQMLIRDKVFEEALKTWTEKQKLERPVSLRPHMLSDEETAILQSFVEATEVLIKSVKMASICNSVAEQELFHLATQASNFLDRLYPAGKLAEPAIRTQVSDLVSSMRTLYNETSSFITDKAPGLQLRADIEEKLVSALGLMEGEMRKVYEIGGLPHFQVMEDEVLMAGDRRSKEKGKFKFGKLKKSGRKDKDNRYGPNVLAVQEWGTEEVGHWLEAIGLGEYSAAFIMHDIRGRELLSLGRQDLKDLGVSKVGHMKRIQHGIKDITSKSHH